MSTKYLIIACLAILGLGTGVGMVLQKQDNHGHTMANPAVAATTPENTLPGVAVVHPVLLNAENNGATSYFGEVLSNLDGQIFAYREGVIERFLVDLGSRVVQGQTVALLSPGQLSPEYADMLSEKESMVIKSKAMIQVAEANLARAKTLGATATDTTVEVVTEQQMLANAKQETNAMIALEREKINLKARKVEVGLRNVYATILQIFYGGYFQVSSPNPTNATFGSLNAQTIINLNNGLSALKNTVEHLPTTDQNTAARIGLTAADSALKTLDATQVGGDYTLVMFADDREKMNMAKDSLVDAWNEYQEQVAMLKKVEATSRAQISDQEQKLSRMQADGEKMLITARADLEAALQARAIIAAASGNREVRSPFSGTITQRLVNVGQKITMADPLFAIVQDVRGKNSSLFVRFEVPESELANLKVGDEIKIARTQNPLQEIRGTIERVGVGINPLTRGIQAEARLTNPPADILPHASVRVTLDGDHKQSVTIPRDSVLSENDGTTNVLVVRDSMVTKQSVYTGRTATDRVVISQGLTPDDQVVINPAKVTIGQKVNPELPDALKVAPTPAAEIDMGEHAGHKD